ncbi:MAG: cytochrome P450 [Acidimicrobiales bacterium]
MPDSVPDAMPLTSSPASITEPALYETGVPYERFAVMRETPGLVWHPYESSGFWAVTRYDDVKKVSATPEVFSSGMGHTNLWDLEADALEARRSIIDTDAPDHTRLRRLVSRIFTPRSIRRWEDLTRAITAELLDDFIERGGGDWVELVAAPLPIRVILSILGVPIDDADYLVELSNYLVEGTGDRPSLPDDAFGNTTPLRLLPFGSPASHALYTYGENLGAERHAEPQDDLVTQLVQAADEGDRLSASEFRNLFHVLVFAGNETTRTALSHGAIAFAEHPDQWQRVVDESNIHDSTSTDSTSPDSASPDSASLDAATEEVLRWATPVLHMRRTAAVDAELAGTPIARGDKVVMWYASANRDPAMFEDPMTFDVGRPDNRQCSFGSGGPHFCLGASLARMEIRVVLEEMAKRRLALELRGEPVRAASNFVNGILSVQLAPADS